MQTLQTISFLTALYSARPDNAHSLVLVPPYVVHNWSAEFARWLPQSTLAPGGGAPASRHLTRHHVFMVQAAVVTEEAAKCVQKWVATPGGALIISFAKFVQLVLMTKPEGRPRKAAAAASSINGMGEAVTTAETERSRAAELARMLREVPASVVVDEGHYIRNPRER